MVLHVILTYNLLYFIIYVHYLFYTTVFLPGIQEITKLIDEIYKKEFFTDPSKTVVYPLHSSLSTAEQTAVFDVPPQGVRKIVCATNIGKPVCSRTCVSTIYIRSNIV